MAEEQTQQRVCPHCGGTHLDKEITITFKGPLVEAIEAMAKRRKESVEQFVFHLLWLEAGKVKGVRALMEHEEH